MRRATEVAHEHWRIARVQQGTEESHQPGASATHPHMHSLDHVQAPVPGEAAGWPTEIRCGTGVLDASLPSVTARHS